jgi:hypothetical protein
MPSFIKSRQTVQPLKKIPGHLKNPVPGRLGKGLAGESATQRATKIATGGFPVAVSINLASELKGRLKGRFDAATVPEHTRIHYVSRA